MGYQFSVRGRAAAARGAPAGSSSQFGHGRALFYWSMLSQGYWLAEFLSISQILKRAPAQYSRSFVYTETDENDLTYFVLHQLGVISRAIEELQVYLRRKMREVREVHSLLKQTCDLNHRQLALLSHALRHPGMHYTIQSHRTSHNVVYQTARTDLLDLADRGLLIQQKSGKAYIFIAPPNLGERLTSHAQLAGPDRPPAALPWRARAGPTGA